MKRQSRKINSIDFLILMCLESQKGSPSYNDLVSRYDAMYNISASKQALWKRVNEPCVIFFQTVLARLIKAKVSSYEVATLKACGKYSRVIIQDSTIIQLPLRLFKIFSGVSNLNESVCNARIQGVYDILACRFIHFSIDPYSKNDIAAAKELELQKGDLVLRDRGYHSSAEILRHLEAHADCIYRYKSRTAYYYPDSGKPINLLELLEKHGKLDIEVCLNNEKRTKIRLIANPVSQEIANARRRKAKKQACGHNPSNDVLKLMSWTIFITTIPKSEANFDQILSIYRLRWRIEIIFKTWKSHMHFAKVHTVARYQLNVLLTARFIMIIICTHNLFNHYNSKVRLLYDRDLSMMKFINYLKKNQDQILELIQIAQKNTDYNVTFYEKLCRYCSYDKRKRLNLNQLMITALLG